MPASGALPVAVDDDPLPSLAPVLERVTPSVVNVYTQTRVRVRSPLMDDPFFRRFFNVPDLPREGVEVRMWRMGRGGAFAPRRLG